MEYNSGNNQASNFKIGRAETDLKLQARLPLNCMTN